MDQPDIVFDLLQPAATELEYRLNRAAHEWSLAESIVINGEDDIRSKVQWADDFRPHKHQIDNLITFCRRLPVALLADDVGLGKTISAGLIVGELMTRNKVRRTLVVAPKVLGPQWVEELGSKFGIAAVAASGAALDAALRNESLDAVVTTYQSAARAVKVIEQHPFEMLILDEAHKLRNLHGSAKPPIMATALFGALKNRLFKYVVMLTATPIQNRLWDLYSLIDCLTVAKGHKNPLGSPDGFVWQYLADGKTKARKLEEHKIHDFHAIVRQYLNRTRRQDVPLVFPQREVRILAGQMSPAEEQLFDLYREAREGLNGLMRSSLERALFSSPAAFAKQVENTKASVPGLDEAGALAQELDADPARTAKMRTLLEVIDELKRADPKHWRLVVFTIRKETQRAIVRVLRDRGIRCGTISGGAATQNRRSIHEFHTESSPDVAPGDRSRVPGVHVLVSTDAGAEGVNLQVANTLVNYDLPWNPMVVEQRIGRIQRMGSKYAGVAVFNLVVSGGVEEKVVARLISKLQSVTDAVGEIESILENVNTGGGEGEKIETEVARLVDRAFREKDVERDLRMKEKSFADAKATLAKNRGFIDGALSDVGGAGSEGGSDEPQMPKLNRTEPAMAAESFAIAALQADGWKLEARSPKRFLARRPGHSNRTIHFNRREWQDAKQGGAFQGRTADLYLPGRPEFERAVQRRLAAGSLDVHQLDPNSMALAEELVDRWLENVPGASRSTVTQTPARRFFSGNVVCRASISNGVDSYEKLVECVVGPPGHRPVDADIVKAHGIPLEPVRADALVNRIKPAVLEAYLNDPDMSAFDGFYRSRMDTEMQAAGGDFAGEKRIREDFLPRPRGQVVAARGVAYHEQSVQAAFTIDGEGPYEVALNCIPAIGWVDEVPAETCAITRGLFPATCLQVCEETGGLGLRHRMARSEASGVWMLPDEAVRCVVSGVALRPSECTTLPSDGRVVDTRLTDICAVTEEPGLSSEMTTCEVTGVNVLASQMVTSDFSAKRFRSDEAVRCAVTHGVVHRDEAVRTADGGWVVLTEAQKSDLSGRWFPRESARQSQKSGRTGGEEEGAVCTESGAWLLEDELGESDVSGKQVDTDFLEISQVSDRRGIASEFQVCDLTAKKVLDDELTACAATGRKIAVPHVRTSGCSGQVFGEDLCETCAVTEVCCGPGEWIECPVSKQKVAQAETAVCPVSGERCYRGAMIRCPVSQRLLSPAAMKICEFSGDLIDPESLLISSLSGRVFRRDQSVVSSRSGFLLHKSESVETASGDILSPDEAVQSEVSGEWVYRADAVKSDRTGRWGTSGERVQCVITKRWLLTDEAEESVLSGRTVDKTQVVRSALSGRTVAPDEVTTCEQTQRVVAQDEIGVCADSGLKVVTDLLTESDICGKTFLTSRMKRCSVSGSWCGPEEWVECPLTEDVVALNRCQRCAISGRYAHDERMVQCGVTGAWFLPDEAVFCDWSGAPVHPRILKVCNYTDAAVHPKFLDNVGKMSAIFILAERSRSSPHARDGVILDAVQAVCPELKNPQMHAVMRGESGKVGLVVGTCSTLARRMLIGKKRYFVAFFQRGEHGKAKVRGKVSVFRKAGGGLNLIDG